MAVPIKLKTLKCCSLETFWEALVISLISNIKVNKGRCLEIFVLFCKKCWEVEQGSDEFT